MVSRNLWSIKKKERHLAVNFLNTLEKISVDIGLYSFGELLSDDPFWIGITLAMRQQMRKNPF